MIHTQVKQFGRPTNSGYKVFIATTYYKVFVDNCGMTQSIVFIRCENEEKANQIKILDIHCMYLILFADMVISII